MAYENKDIGAFENARAWLDMAQAKWRLQTMQHRSRYNPKTGEYRQLPTRIRRFLNGTPVGMKTAVLAILKESAPYRSPVFDCETDEGLVYNPTNTFIRKDGVEHSTGGKDPTYTIIQDLLLDDGNRDSFMFGDESSCAQVGETEYRWDEPYVEDCPDGGQGVSYQVTDISRDRETDLFSYRIRKVQALTVHVAPHVESCDARRRVTTEIWDNVYGEPGAFVQDPVRGGSAPIDLPDPCSQPDGRTVKIDVYRNPDCTYRLTVQTADAKTDDGPEGQGAQYSIYHDQYKTNASEKVLNAFLPLPKQGVDFSDGTMTRYSSERNEDGTWNNTTERETERPVPSSTVETRITPRGTRISRTDTNQRAAASGIATAFGSWKSTKTPGGLYTNEYSEYTRNLVADLGLVCGDTAFMHTHETQESVTAVPGDGSHVPAASGGLVTTRTYDTDADGFVTMRERKEQEHTVEYAMRRATSGFLGNTSGFQHRSVPKSVADSLLSHAARGTTVEARMTNGNMWDVEVQTFVTVAGQTLGFDCSRTIYQHVHEIVTSASSVGAEARDAGGGHTYRKSYSVDTATGAITCREQDTTELPVAPSRKSVRVTARGTETRLTKANMQSLPAEPSRPGSALEWERTPGGRYTYTETATVPKQLPSGESCSADAFLHSDGATTMSANMPSAHLAGGSGGKYRERSSRLGDDGLWEITTVEHSEHPDVDNGVDIAVTARGMRRTVKVRQAAKPEEPNANDAGKALRSSRTRGGLYDVETTVSTPRTGPLSVECADDMFLHVHGSARTTVQADAADVTPTALRSGIYRGRRQQLGDDGLWTVSDTTSQEHEVTDQRVDERVTRYGKVRRVTDMQVGNPAAALAAAASEIGKEAISEVTRGGRWNVTRVESVTPLSGKIAEACEKTAFLHTHMDTTLEASLALNHVDDAGGRVYREETWTLTEIGTWERRKTDRTELEPSLHIQQYEDAFGERTVTEEFAHGSEDGSYGKTYSSQALIRSVESTLTNGKAYNVRTTAETPTEVDSGWQHVERQMSNGLSAYNDFIVFRNATLAQVEGWLDHVSHGLGYKGTNGSFSSHPSASIAPNRFGLWDGTISVTTTFTPQAWASGGTTRSENWETRVTVKSVNFVPLSQTKLLKVVTEETHLKGGGVGRELLRAKLAGGVIKGSQFSFHPGGQTCSYDIITKVTTKGVVIDMPKGAGGTTIWEA